jgi:hypothetical protein
LRPYGFSYQFGFRRRHPAFVVSTIPVRTDKLLLETLSVPKIDCRPRAVVSAKWEYSRTKPETFGDFHFKIGEPSPETKSNARKAGISGPFSRFLGSLSERTNGWLGREDSNL